MVEVTWASNRDCRAFAAPLRSGTPRVSYDHPEEIIFRRSRRDRAPYPIWRGQGLLLAAEGNTTDFKFIEAEILALASLSATSIASFLPASIGLRRAFWTPW